MKVLVANATSSAALAIIRSLGSKGVEITGASDNRCDFPFCGGGSATLFRYYGLPGSEPITKIPGQNF